MPSASAAIGLRAFLLCVWRCAVIPPGSPVRWSRTRALAMLVFLPLCLVLRAVHAAAFLLDELLFPGYRRVAVRAPLFVVGPPRCGTTFLHRALARDTARFTAFTLGEMVFAPAIVEKKLLRVLGRIDRALGSRVARRVRRAEEAGFEDISRLHGISFFEPEEDYVLFAYIFANPLLLAMFPFPDVLGHLWRFDAETPPAQRARALGFYRRCVQRHLYHHGAHKTLLSKNPYFTPMIAALAAEFPDARFACNVRTPRASVPSMLGLWRQFYGWFDNRPGHYFERDFVVDYMHEFYEMAIARLGALPPERAAFFPYDGLVAHPRAAIAALYARFGLELGPDFAAALEDEEARAARHKAAQQFDLAAFGLEPAAFDARFASIAVHFGFE